MIDAMFILMCERAAYEPASRIEWPCAEGYLSKPAGDVGNQVKAEFRMVVNQIVVNAMPRDDSDLYPLQIVNR